MVSLNSSAKSVFAFSSVQHFFASALGDLQKACAFIEKAGTVAGGKCGNSGGNQRP